jgi:hypothetical protein
VALFNTNQIQLNRLANESVSGALVTDGCKTLNVVTKFYWYEPVQYLEADHSPVAPTITQNIVQDVSKRTRG